MKRREKKERNKNSQKKTMLQLLVQVQAELNN